MFWILSKILGFVVLMPIFLVAFIYGSINNHSKEQDIQIYKSRIQEWDNFLELVEQENISFIGFGDCKRIIFRAIEDEEYSYMADPLSAVCATNVGYAEFDQSGEYKWSKIKKESESLLPNNDMDSIKIEDLWSDGIDSMEISFSEPKLGQIIGLLYEARENLKPTSEDIYHKQITENWFVILYHPSPF